MYFDSDQFWRNKSSRSCEGFNRDRGPPRHARGVIDFSSCWSYFIVYVMFVAKKTVVKGEEYLRQFVANSFRHMLARSYGNRTWYV